MYKLSTFLWRYLLQFDFRFAGYDFTSKSVSKDKIGLTYHRITEAFKFGFARRSELGDDDFVDVEEVRDINRLFFPTKFSNFQRLFP